jgi:hypothetical protein
MIESGLTLPMDTERKRQLKAQGKAEVERRSAQLKEAMRAANPARIGSDEWAKNYKAGTLREKELKKVLPILHKRELERQFAILPVEGLGIGPLVGLYLQCRRCGSVLPSAIPKRFFYWGACECGNVKWRILWRWNWNSVSDPSLLVPVKLIGKG